LNTRTQGGEASSASVAGKFETGGGFGFVIGLNAGGKQAL